MEGNDSPAATPRNSTASSKPSIWAKFNTASVATPADVMARQTDSLQLEFDQYMAQAPISRSSCPMRWWAQHKPSYLILSSVAQTMLCMPATSVASERFFSKAGDVSRANEIRWCRRKLTLSFFCCIALRPLEFWRSYYVTQYVGLCTLGCQIWTLALLHKYDRWTFVRPIEFHLNTYVLMLSLFSELDIVSFYEDCRTFLRRWNV